ncbi:hypothetical protein HB780_13395 (plasmid) [Rhizobium lusitanum]|uniref:hypothetical protein n=1 Tax=Rhizobium lusitanum TaxID=293958 RepID=UPI0016196DA8|nr:hypothetical protein [Rhizobium lusitanum]QND46604.1 hypothetical protein HB780_13395 [Rhizobium lusitanum]
MPDKAGDRRHIAGRFAVADVGRLPGQKLLPAKTRAFVDFITHAFRAQKLKQVVDRPCPR